MPVAFEVDIAPIVENVFRTMLGLEIYRSDASSSTALNPLTAAVHFAGEWKGAVLLQCGLPEALAFTNCLMVSEEQSRADDDVRDALGELTNMVGGNLKSVLPPGVALSIPSVVAGTDYALHICGGNAYNTVGFSSELGSFWVTLVQVVERKQRNQ